MVEQLERKGELQKNVEEGNKAQESIEISEQKIEYNQKNIEELPQKSEQTKEQIERTEGLELPKEDQEKLENIKTLSPKKQIKVLVDFALDKKEKGGPQRAIEVAAELNNPHVLDGVRDELAKKINELIEEKKIKEI